MARLRGRLHIDRKSPSVSARVFCVLLLVVLVAAGLPVSTVAMAPPAQESSPLSEAAPPPGKTSEAVTRTDRVLVRWTTRLTAKAAAAGARLATLGSATGREAAFVRFTGSGAAVYDLGGPLGDGARAVLAALGKVDGVASVEPDLWMTADVLPNDPRAAELWGLLGAADGSPYGIDARGAWGTSTGAGVVVAVIDTGLVAHEDLAGQAVAGYDMVSVVAISNDGDGRDSDPADPGDWSEPGDPCPAMPSSWHGTHVAGTIAGLADNGIGVFGGAPSVKIQPVRVLGTCFGYTADIADGIRWAAGGSVPGVPPNLTPARVLNLSLGGAHPSCPFEYSSAIADARSRGSVVVVSAGNEASDASARSPANCDGVITVAAVGQAGLRASFSNYGSTVELAGPGVSILSTVDSGATSPTGSGYVYHPGTSMAAPHVALSAALVAAAYPGLTPDAIAVVLEGSATAPAPDASGSGCAALGCGAGIVNAGRAITRLAGVTPIVGRVTASMYDLTPNAPFSVNAGAVDLTGIASAQVSVDGGGWTAMSAADGAFGGTSESLNATINAPATGGNHTICVRATDPGSNTSDGTACVIVVVFAPPPGDDFVSAIAIAGFSGSINGSNVGASTEAGEPPTSTVDLGNGPNNTVWYRWTAPSSGTATFDLCANPNYDTMLAVYLGSSLGSLARVTDDDDTFGCGNNRQSKVTFAAGSGSTYQIQVDGFVGGTGTFTLTWTIPGAIPPDTTGPSGTVSIDGGNALATSAAVGLAVPANDPSGVSQVRISNDPGMAGADIRPYATPQSWTLAAGPDGGRTVYAQWQDTVGNWSAISSDSISLDTSIPTVSAPAASLANGAALAKTTVPVRVAWSGSDTGSGLARFELEMSTNGGGYVPLALPSPTVTNLAPALRPGSASYRFRTRAVDAAGNASAWAHGPIFHVRQLQESGAGIRYAGTWSRGSAAAALGGRYRSTTRAGASVSFTFTGRSIAWVAHKATALGSARVYIDGRSAGVVNLRASSNVWRTVAFSRTWATSGRHTIKIVGLGTRGHPRVDFDAFVVLW